MGKIMLNGVSYGGGRGGTTGDYMNKVDPEGSGSMYLNLESTSSKLGGIQNIVFGDHTLGLDNNTSYNFIQGYHNKVQTNNSYNYVEGRESTLSGVGDTHIEGANNAVSGNGYYHHIEGYHNVISGPGNTNHVGGTYAVLSGGDLQENFFHGSYTTLSAARLRNNNVIGSGNNNRGTNMDRTTIIGDYNITTASNSVDDTIILGHYSTACGSHNMNIGDTNQTAGTYTAAFGSNNSISNSTTSHYKDILVGSNNSMYGSASTQTLVFGSSNVLYASTSDKNAIVGHNNKLNGYAPQYTYIFGEGNEAINGYYNFIIGKHNTFNGSTVSDRNIILGTDNVMTCGSERAQIEGSLLGGCMSTISASPAGATRSGTIEGAVVLGRSLKLESSADGALQYGPMLGGYWSTVTLTGNQYGGLYQLAFSDAEIKGNAGSIINGYGNTIKVNGDVAGSIIGGKSLKTTCSSLDGTFIYGNSSTVKTSNSYTYGSWIGGQQINYQSTVSPYGGIIHGFLTTVENSNIYGGIIVGEGNSLTSADIEGGLLSGRANALTGEVESVIVGGFYSTVSDSKYALVSGYKNNVTSASYSVVGGNSLIANAENQTIFGKFNTTPTTATAFAIGNGTTDARSNALTVDWNGNVAAAGDITFTYNGQTYNLGAVLSAANII